MAESEGLNEIAIRATTSVAAGVAGMIDPAVGLAALALKEVLDPTAVRLISVIRSHREERAVRVLSAGSAESQLSVDRFSNAIENSPALLALMAESVQAAMDTPLESKILALGRCLGRGVKDEARVDEERLRVRGLSRIDEPEVKLMELLNQQTRLATTEEIVGDDSGKRWPGWRRPEILDELPGFASVLDASIARLTAEGLVRDDGIGRLAASDGFREMWVVTDFGKECLRLLREVGNSKD
jgi:hypothetical protein